MTDYDGALLSYGGGVNTVAMVIRLAKEGWTGPIVFADTGGEHPETYCHIKWMDEWLKGYGMSVTTLSYMRLTEEERRDAPRRASISYGRVADTLEEYCLAHGMIPLLAIRWCSIIFKRSVIQAWAQKRGYEKQLVGISADEPQRIRDDPNVLYPLNDWGWRRQDCIDYIKENDVPVPRKSGCFFCPAQKRSEWRDLLMDNPELYERAAVMERKASEKSGKLQTFDPSGKVTLEDLAMQFDGQTVMDFANEADMRAYEPCICGL